VKTERHVLSPATLGFLKTPFTVKEASRNFVPFGARRGSPGGSKGSRKHVVILAELNAASAPVVWSTYTVIGFAGWPGSAAFSVQTASCTPGEHWFETKPAGSSALTGPLSSSRFGLRSSTWTPVTTVPIVVPAGWPSVTV
jgi:hypothetical protein